MIKKYQFGQPTYDCEAIVNDVAVTKETIPYVHVTQDEQLHFHYTMHRKDRIYGLGENVRGINKRGFTYTSKCNDEGRHLETISSLYAAHNFFIVDGAETFGVFVDCPGIVTFDIGYSHIDELHVTCENKDLYMYIIEDTSVLNIIKAFRQAIGQSYIPPKWAFGYGQSRWGYKTSEDVRFIAKKYQKHNIPLDAIYLDIDYMENYKDFTIDRKAFPDFEELVDEMKQQSIHLVPIIDAGVRIEKGYTTYEEGVANNYFCKDEDGNDFVAGVWPGKCHFPDVLNKDARTWFGNQYAFLLEKGIEGFWNDMNEPSIFYTETRLNKAFALADQLRSENLNVDSFFQLVNTFSSLSNNREDYKLFYHNVDGKKMRHDKVHNQFGYAMTRAANEAFERLYPEKRILLFSRSSSIGMHRHGGVWTGDNYSWWSHLLLNIKMMPSLNMCGFLYVGADLGGFAQNTTQDLMMRWLQFGIFAPLMRNHSACEREQELFRFEDIEDFQHIIELRYALLPYLYSEYMKSALQGDLYFKPLAFVYDKDEHASQVEDQLMLGESIMLAPIYEQNANGRYVYLPEDMKLVRFRSYHDYDTEVLQKGHHYVSCELHELLVFIKKNHILPLAQPAMNTSSLSQTSLSILGYVEDEATYSYYDDDGYSKTYAVENSSTIHVRKEKDGYTMNCTKTDMKLTTFHL